MASVTTDDLSGGLPEAREFVLVDRPDDGVRDAVNVWIEEENAALAMRIGVEAVADAWDNHEMWLDIAFPDGRLYQGRGSCETRDPIAADGKARIRATGPVRFECLEPYRRWSVRMTETQVAALTAQTLIDDPHHVDTEFVPVSFDIEMTMRCPPWEPGTMTPEGREAMGGKQGEFMSPRFEQLFHCTGTLVLDGETIDFSGNGLRIRRTGFRAFSGFSGHCWASAAFPSGKAFGFNVYPSSPDGGPVYSEGWVIDEDGKRVGARPVGVPWLRKLVTGGERFEIELETLDGRTVEIAGVTYANTRSRGHPNLPADFPVVQQAHATFTWDGEVATGMLERSSKPSVMDD